jgi:hypothetical protein
VEFLAHGNFLGEAQDAAIAADKQSFRDLFERGAAAGHPRCLDGQADAYAITLAEAVGNGSHSVFHEIAEFQTSMQILGRQAGEWSFVVPTNSIRRALRQHRFGDSSVAFFACQAMGKPHETRQFGQTYHVGKFSRSAPIEIDWVSCGPNDCE